MAMALIHLNFFSEVLGLSCSLDVILPDEARDAGPGGKLAGKRFPVLWLLHGMGDDHTIWQRRTSIERYVAPLGLAVVMPSVELSYYANMAHGLRYFDYVAEELPQVCRGCFPLSEKREDNFVAGLSMGGYGALKTGLSFPGRYAAIGCLSAGNFPAGPKNPGLSKARKGSPAGDIPMNAFGVAGAGSVLDCEELLGTENDCFFLLDRAIAAGGPVPRVFHACGAQDFLIENVRRTRDYFQARADRFRYEYHEARGIHSWDFWDEWIRKFLDFIRPDLEAERK
jgi:putative tributyrin esterase